MYIRFESILQSMFKVIGLVVILILFSCVKQVSQLPEKEMEQVELTGFYSFVFNFKAIDTLDAFEVTLANSTFHKGEYLKKIPNHIEIEEAQLIAYFKENNQVVDSVVFENPLHYKFEVFENGAFQTGIIYKDSSSIMLRVNSAAVDEIQILKEDSILSTFKVQ